MVTRTQLDELQSVNARIEDLVRSEVMDLMGMVGRTDPDGALGLLVDILPALVNEYGLIAQTAAAEWYESTYGARAHLLASGTPAVAVQSNVKYKATGLFTGDAETALDRMAASAIRHVRNQGRDTIMLSAERNGGRWARVPRGGKTCAFCLMLASRDAVYISEETASVSRRTGEDYHDDCRCEAVQINSWDEYPEGYDPDAYYEMYNNAAEVVGNRFDTKSITAEMRRLYPDLLRDGVFTK